MIEGSLSLIIGLDLEEVDIDEFSYDEGIGSPTMISNI